MNPRAVFVSSTSRDLPEYRDAVLRACRELHLGVVGMEDFPAMGVDATTGSLQELDLAHVYVGIFAYRYGHVPADGDPRSVTEREFDHAGARHLERLCFMIDPTHPWPEDRKEHPALPRLEFFKERVQQSGLIVARFTTPEQLRHEVYKALQGWVERSDGRPRGPRQVPAPPRDFVGRDDVLAELVRDFEGGVSISGVRGQGGVGKTALAQVLAERLAPRFPDGQVYLELRGVSGTPLSWREAVAHVIHSFLPEERLPDADAALRGLYQTVLAGKRVLLLLDNAADRNQVEPLLPPRSCAVLVTSRRRFTLPGLLPRDLDSLPASAAVALLRRLVPRLGEEADEMARLCGYLPLALRLAGSLLAERDDLPPQRYLQRLREKLLVERTGLAEVATTIQLSEELLPEPLRTRWGELAVLVDGFETGWAAAVWDVDEENADDWLGTLRKNSLLEWDGETQFYRLHDLVREYAANGLDQDRRRAVAYRHASCFCRILCDADASFEKGGAAILEALQRFDRSWPNARSSFAWIQETMAQDDEIARLCCRLVNGSHHVRSLRQHPRDQIAWLEQVIQSARQIHDRKEEGVALGSLGNVYADLGQPLRAIDFHRQHLSIAQEIGDRQGEGAALGNLGYACKNLGQLQRAIEYHEQALLISREIGDRRAKGQDLGNLGYAYAALGQPQRAIEYHEQALLISREIGDRRAEGQDLGNLGIAYAALGQPQRASDFYQQHLTIAREIGDRLGEGRALGNLGYAYVALGQPQRAIDFYQQWLTIAREVGDRRSEADACWNLGEELVKLDRLAEAIPLMEVCVRFEQEIGHPNVEKDAAHVEQLRQRLDGE